MTQMLPRPPQITRLRRLVSGGHSASNFSKYATRLNEPHPKSIKINPMQILRSIPSPICFNSTKVCCFAEIQEFKVVLRRSYPNRRAQYFFLRPILHRRITSLIPTRCKLRHFLEMDLRSKKYQF